MIMRLESIIVADLLPPDLIQRFAGSLLHFIWEGALLAMVAAIVLRLLSDHSPKWRYTAAVVALFTMLVAPILTLMFYARTGEMTKRILQGFSGNMKFSASSAAQTALTATWTQWIVLVWFAGVLLCTVRLISGWYIARSLTTVGASRASSPIQREFEEIRNRLALTKPVQLLLTLRIDTPVAVGWLRPVVLLPFCAVTGLNEDHLRAVLAHELAHIRRHDFLVNILQRSVESVLFYHPAVWWISSRIRSERELCCDDLAVQVCGNRSLYAQALIELEDVRGDVPSVAVAATGGVLTRRIHRLLGYRVVNSDLQSAVSAMVFVAVWLWIGAWQTDRTLQAKTPAPVPAPIAMQSPGTPAVERDIMNATATPTPKGVNSEIPVPGAGTAINAIAAIVTAQPPAAVLQVQPTQATTVTAAPAAAASAATGSLALFVNVQVEGGGPIPIFANGRYPRLRLTKLDTKVPYEMPFNNVAIIVPLNLEFTPDEYKATVEDLPAGFTLKSITYRADEPGVRIVDSKNQNLQISPRAIGASYAGNSRMLGIPELPISITLVRTSTPPTAGVRVTGSSDGTIVMPAIPGPGKYFQLSAPDATIYISDKPGILYSDGTFEFAGVSPGLHAIILKSNMGADGAQRIDAAQVVVRNRNVSGVSLQTVPILPRNVTSARQLPPAAEDASAASLASLSLRVQDEATKQPITSGWMTLSGTGTPLRFYIGVSGVEMPKVLPGEYQLGYEADGYESVTRTITVGRGNTPVLVSATRLPK